MKAPTIAILAALGGFQAAAQQISDTSVWVDPTTCDPWARSHGFPAAGGPDGLFTVALGIFDKMVDANMYRMYNPSKQSPTTLPANVLAWERYRLNSTFDALFGSDINLNTSYGSQGVWDVLLNLQGVRAQWAPQIGEPPHITVVCDDAPYLSKNSKGKVVYTDPYTHSPVQLPGDDSITDGVTTGCATNGQSSYENYNVVVHFENVILCTKNMNLPLGFTSKGPTTFGSGTTVDVMGKSWLGALYTQALWTMQADAVAYGFAASHAIRNSHLALWNPDSNKFFAFALMFDGLFWGSGVGKTSQQEYARLQKTAAGKRIIAAFGLTNIAVPARGITWAPGWVPPDLMNPQNRHIGAIPRS